MFFCFMCLAGNGERGGGGGGGDVCVHVVDRHCQSCAAWWMEESVTGMERSGSYSEFKETGTLVTGCRQVGGQLNPRSVYSREGPVVGGGRGGGGGVCTRRAERGETGGNCTLRNLTPIHTRLVRETGKGQKGERRVCVCVWEGRGAEVRARTCLRACVC